MKAFATRLLRKAGLFGVVFDLYDTARGLNLDTLRANRRVRREAGPGDLPLPPLPLVTSTAGTPSLRWFLESGTAAADCILDALSRNGTDLGHLDMILDFGCGCGRVVRQLPSITGAAIHGVDINPRAIRWCRKHLTFGNFEISALKPPLSFPDGAFDLVYSLSVFTHLPEQLQQSWARELLRILSPGGLLLASLHGPSYLPQMSEHERRAFLDGKLVVRGADASGSNRCAAYHQPGYAVKVLFNGFEFVEHQPEGAAGNPHQDLYLMRKPAISDVNS